MLFFSYKESLPNLFQLTREKESFHLTREDLFNLGYSTYFYVWNNTVLTPLNLSLTPR